jgi:hypothetical protein
MAPNIRDSQTWQQADTLLQPIFIRLVDHFRQALDQSGWVGEYSQREIWPDHVEEAVKVRRQALLEGLETCSGSEAAVLEAELATLPAPYPGYELGLFAPSEDPHLRAAPLHTFDLWELCYEICFTNYPQDPLTPAVVDARLFDDSGDVDWQRVDEKTKALVQRLFPSPSGQT